MTYFQPVSTTEKLTYHNLLAQFLNSLEQINFKKIIMALNIKPLSDRVMVEPAAAETTTAAGIIIPDTAKEKPQRGTVVAVGNGKQDHTMTVKIGDTVLYGKYAGTELKYEGKDYLIMREDDILAII
jgi:chaperonin GroES